MSQASTASSTAPSVAASGPSTFEWQGKNIEIRNVWASNLEEEMANIRELLPRYNHIAMVRRRFAAVAGMALIQLLCRTLSFRASLRGL